MQAGADWMPPLALLQPEDRKSLYGLSVADQGLDVSTSLLLPLPLYLRQLLTDQLEPIAEGSNNKRIISPLYRMAIQVCKLPSHQQIQDQPHL